MGRGAMGQLFYEDFDAGGVLESRDYEMTEADIIAFGRKFDPLPMHTDPVAARDGLFGGLIASAFHTLAVTATSCYPCGLVH